MEKSFKFALIACLAVASTACLQTREDIEAQKNKRDVQDQVITLQKSNADASNKFAEVEDDIRNLNGRVEVLETRNQQAQAAAQQQAGADDAKLVEVDKKITLLQEELTRVNGNIDALQAELNALKASQTAQVTEPSGSQGLFDVAEEHFDKKEYKKAILAFNKFRDQNPKSKRLPSATLRIGQSFAALGMKDEAKTFFEDVVAKFPKSDEAKQAKTLLKKK